MFRYIALAWNPASSRAANTAAFLGLELMARDGWHAAAGREGLQLMLTGDIAGINSAQALGAVGGVVLGKLFHRSDPTPITAADLLLTDDEQGRIQHTSGRELLRSFWGRYVAFLPSQSGTTSVIRDPSGTLPCFMLRHEGVTVVFSWLEDALELLSHLRLPGVDWDALAAHVLLGELGGMATCLEGVYQVLPGQRVDLETGDSEMLWQPLDIARSPLALSSEEAAERLGATVRDCTRAWASCYDTILLRLSGGVDSSILASCVARGDTRTDVLCLNYHSPGSDSDERHYARLAAQKSGWELLERERNPNFQIQRVLGIARMPTPVNYVGWMNADTDATVAAAHSAGAMFTGAGGDQLFYEFGAWWPLADYLRWRGLDRSFFAAALDAARLGRVSLWRALALAAVDRVRPSAQARQHLNRSVLLGSALRETELKREQYVHPHLLHGTDLPIGKHMQALALLHPIGYYDPFHQQAAVEIVSPLFSQPLVELSLSLPTYQLTEGGQGRSLARRAFANELPPEITTRRSKGGMEEHSIAVLQHNLPLVRELLLDGELARRGLLDRPKTEELLSGRPTALVAHPSQIHALVAVEAWLTRWCRPGRSAAP